MKTELQMLAFATVLGFIHLIAATIAATVKRGTAWNLSSRETPVPPLPGAYGRIDRAFENFKETFPLFIAAVLLLEFTQRSSNFSALGAQIYFGARLAYFVVYAAGITIVRTALWVCATAGIAMVLAASLMG